MKKKRKYLTIKERIKLGFILFFVLLFILVLCLRANEEACEWWTVNITRIYENALGRVSSLVPISFLEVWFVVLIVGSILFLVLMIRSFIKRRNSEAFHSLTSIVLMVVATVSIYQSTCGLAYGRKKVDIIQFEERVSSSSFIDVIEYYIDDFNYVTSLMEFDESGSVICPYTFDELNNIYQEEFKRLESKYFNSYTPKVKNLYLTSWLYTELWITGVFFAPSGDANINYMIPKSSLPYTMAHELAHSKGVMREDDANLVSLYINVTSDLPYLRYSAYISTFYALLSMANFVGDDNAYAELYYSMDQRIFQNQKVDGDFWNSHTLINDIGEWFNNLYLSINGTEGTGSYTDKFEDDEEIIIDGDTGEEVIVHLISSFSPYQKLYFALYPYDLIIE